MNDFFLPDISMVEASAPGRLDVMGGIADYSGSLLLQMPIKERTTVKIQRRPSNDFIYIRTSSGKSTDDFIIAIDQLPVHDAQSFANAITSQSGGDWAPYVLGCIFVFVKARDLQFDGLNIFIDSQVPIGKGVSSSAALEMATLCALSKLYASDVDSSDLPLLAQQAENKIVGAPCGLMDQLTSHLGEKNKLLPLICQPHNVFPTLSLPNGISFCGIDSGIRHAVTGASYAEVRAAAFMAYSFIALGEGASVNDLRHANETGDWKPLPFGGYLANIPLSVFESKFQENLPVEISGREFLQTVKVSIDQTTTINPERIYRPRACATHPVREQFRVQTFHSLLQQFPKSIQKQSLLVLLGELMFQSHVSYSSVGLGNERTDDLVDMVRSAGSAQGVYGARITGGGSGGTVCILCYGKEGRATARHIFDQYRHNNGITSYFFFGSSHGSLLANRSNV